jgi:hypothetical protein
VAVARDVFHVAFYGTQTDLRYRRSIDLGATWTSARRMTAAGDSFFPQLVVSGRYVVLGYAAFSSSSVYAAYRRSTDTGVNWGTERALTSKSASPAFAPVITFTAGVWTASYERCATFSCGSSAVWTATSQDSSATFDLPSRASHVGPTYAWPLGSGFAGDWVSVYSTFRSSSGAERVWARLGG